ncbi:enoyl-CoA hydratase/isomerase family protein [Bacteriovorax sp. BSW11_IV]|uniref:enoyl-CoA hydratase/isomerase family protein n=1 Tax=Bacteriovorax sp. BSW11_IV TaxID=1353529 RepID=UPI000389DB9F|nr:enoyl-CoA hydratase-related protein [Bacteriovorax sp. BSW11_IV]EQC49366.1 enoyl-CoA hydratase/isomerase family protein [Bacteriovorax sp. BSW11_IV]
MELFNFNTLKTSLCKSTKSLTISLNRPENNQTINKEMLFELESIMNWLSSKVEISSVLLTSTSSQFCTGIDLSEWKSSTTDELLAFQKRITKISKSFSYLPQIVICDLKQNVSAEGIELACGADLRFSRSGMKMKFNFLERGLMPSSAVYQSFSNLFGMQNLKNWLYTNSIVHTDSLVHSGVLTGLYFEQEELTEKLSHIESLSPLARMQSKLAFKVFDVDLEKVQDERITTITKALLSIEDWKSEKGQFTAAREIGSKLKREEMNRQFA